MLCRQHKMHVGKWHLKTFLLSVTLVLVVVVYLRFQALQDFGSRQLREGFEVHVFGAKPYKSLALTRKSMAEMRNKTLSAHKSKRKKTRKSGPESLSVGQLPAKRSRSRDDERRPSRDRPRDGERVERGRRRFHHSKRISSRERSSSLRSTPMKERDPERETEEEPERYMKSSSTPVNTAHVGPDAVSKSAIASLSFASKSPGGLEDAIQTRPLPLVIQNVTTRPSNEPHNLFKEEKHDHETEDKKPKNEASSSDNTPKSERNEHGKSSLESREKNRDLDDDEEEEEEEEEEDRERKDKSDKRSHSGNEKPLLFRGELKSSRSSEKESSSQKKDEESSRREKSEKRPKSKNEEKDGDRHRDSDKSREDRGKGSSRKTESRRKHADIKLIDDTLDTDTSQNKAHSKELRVSEDSANNASDTAKTHTIEIIGPGLQSPLQDPILSGNTFNLGGIGTDASNSSLLAKLFSSSNDTDGASIFETGNDTKGIVNMQMVPRLGEGNSEESNSTTDDEASTVWQAIQGVLKSQGSAEGRSTSDDSSRDSASTSGLAGASPLAPSRAYAAGDVDGAGYGRAPAHEPLDSNAGLRGGYGRNGLKEFDVGFTDTDHYTKGFEDGYRLSARGRAYARMLEEEQANLYPPRGYADLDPYPLPDSPGYGYRRYGSVPRPPPSDVLIDAERGGFGQPQDRSMGLYNRYPDEEFEDQQPRVGYLPPQARGAEPSIAGSRDFSLEGEEDEEDEEDEGETSVNNAGPAASGNPDLTLADSHATPDAGSTMQDLARARMARYAAISASQDPNPTEIKPVSRLARAQQVHSIPQ